MVMTLKVVAGGLLIVSALGGWLTARQTEPSPRLWRLHYGIFVAYGVLILLTALLRNSPYRLVLAVSQLVLALLLAWNLVRIFRAARGPGGVRHPA